MKCSKCLNEIEDDSLFCSVCGSDLRKEVRETMEFHNEDYKETLLQDDNKTKQATSVNVSSTSNLFYISIGIATIACILFFVSAEQISKVADDMVNLRSEAGTSLAEVYYQDIGKALKGFAMFARAFGISVLATTISFSFKNIK